MANATATLLVSLRDEVQEYQRMQAADARAAAARGGVEVELALCGGNLQVQRKQIEEAIRRPAGARPAAVIVQPQASTGLDAVAREALGADVGWVVLGPNTAIESLRQQFAGKLCAQVSTDHRQVGVLQASLFRTLLPRGGKVLYIEGPSTSPVVQLRREGLKAGLQGSPVELLSTLTGDWGEESAQKMVTFWVKLGKGAARPDVVGAQNDSMAVGARKAFQAARPEWLGVHFTGCDGLPDGGMKLVRERILTATVVQPTVTGAAVELVVAALRGRPWSPVTLLPPTVFPELSALGRG